MIYSIQFAKPLCHNLTFQYVQFDIVQLDFFHARRLENTIFCAIDMDPINDHCFLICTPFRLDERSFAAQRRSDTEESEARIGLGEQCRPFVEVALFGICEALHHSIEAPIPD
jgi:hypothetical protein